MRKVKIGVAQTQVAAFTSSLCNTTIIVKRSASGHYFVNSYRNGVKVYRQYMRVSGAKFAAILKVSFSELKKQLFDSTLKYSGYPL